MTDATAKLSELLSAAKGRRTRDDALGFLRREPSTKTILSTTNSRSHRFLLVSRTDLSLSKAKASNGTSRSSSISSDPDGGESPDLAESMRLVRSYAARVKKMTPSPEPASFPPCQPPQGDSFLDRGRGGSFFRRESIHRRQSLSSPPVTRERSPEPASSILRAQYFSPERAASGSNAPFVARLVVEDGPALHGRPHYPPSCQPQARLPGTSSGAEVCPSPPSVHESRHAPRLSALPFRRASLGSISTGLQGSQLRLLALPPPGEDAVMTVKTWASSEDPPPKEEAVKSVAGGSLKLVKSALGSPKAASVKARNVARRASEEAVTTAALWSRPAATTGKARHVGATSEDPARTVKIRNVARRASEEAVAAVKAWNVWATIEDPVTTSGYRTDADWGGAATWGTQEGREAGRQGGGEAGTVPRLRLLLEKGIPLRGGFPESAAEKHLHADVFQKKGYPLDSTPPAPRHASLRMKDKLRPPRYGRESEREKE